MLNLNLNIDEEYKPMVNDLIKYSVMFLVLNILMYISNPKTNKIMSESFTKIMIFSLLGLTTYWLIVKNLIELN